MNAGIIAGQMLVLFFMMLAGFIAFKAHIVSQAGSKSLSSVIINIFNPCLIISGVLNKKITYSPRMVAENLVLVAVFFLVLIVLSRLFTKMMRLLPGEVNSYRLMMIFPNLGFMGIPLVRSLYGEEAVILLVIIFWFILTAYFWLWGQGMIAKTLERKRQNGPGFPGRRCSISEWAPVSRQFLYLPFT